MDKIRGLKIIDKEETEDNLVEHLSQGNEAEVDPSPVAVGERK